MEGIGSEVSHKIRAAIKAKLIELGAYVDDELPDYIMVMVANKRTRAQMDKDLQLFLSSNTKVFTSWLHTVLQKLQEVTVASFECKKDSDSKKSSKRKKSETEDGSGKSSEEPMEKVKKHSKKHKETKKLKRSKHKSKETLKGKKSEKEGSKEKTGKEEEKKASQEKMAKNKKVELNERVGKVILGDLKKAKKLRNDKHDSSQSSLSSDNDSRLDKKSVKETENLSENNKVEAHCAGDEDVLNISASDKPAGVDVDSNKKKEVIEDEFNIEPLKPTEKDNELASPKNENSKEKGTETNIQVEKTISAPTEELLKEHNKMQNEQIEGETPTQQQKPMSDSEESLSPEEIRKQLLLSRAKKKLEESKKAERMRSNSPDILPAKETGGLGGRQKDFSVSSKQPEVRSPQSTRSGDLLTSRTDSPYRSKQRSLYSDRRSLSSERSSTRGENSNYRSKTADIVKSSNEERKKLGLSKGGRNSSTEREGEKGISGDKKKNVIKISESLQDEKETAVRKEADTKSKEKEPSKKRPVPSRVVTIPGPEVPEIPSIVKVKPREFISKDKQANKVLILKAVADAEKSIATVHTRAEAEPEPKKEALYTKNLREKRYEKLAITLSNIRSPESRDRLERRVSVDSEKSDKKRGSSDMSDGLKIKSDLSKKISKCVDQFISSKATIMEKNDKYIRCWLEGVEKAVKDDEMVNPSEMEDFIHSNLTDEEIDTLQKEDERNRKRKSTDATADISSKTIKLTDKEIADLRVLPNTGSKEDGPQIVVTLDGLDSKAIKDLILKNKETTGRPLLSSTKKNERNFGVSSEKPPSESRRLGLEKISDRFGRLNRVNEEDSGRGEKKGSKHQSSETEKKDKVATESKNRMLIAQLSEKFGKVDREFESRKRKRPDEDRRYSYDSRRSDKEDNERNGRYRKSERRSFREGFDRGEIRRTKLRDKCMYWPDCSKGSTCEYFHPSSPCKSLPDIKFKDRYLYLQPSCKNGEYCRENKCPFEHTSDRRARESSSTERKNGMEYHSGSESDSSSDDEDTFDFSFLGQNEANGHLDKATKAGVAEDVRTLLLYQNALAVVPSIINRFKNLKYLDVSSNQLLELPSELCQCPLTTLIAKNNRLSDKSLPPTFANLRRLKELNFSGNEFLHFPAEILGMKSISFLYLGGNKISTVPKEIKNLISLQVLSLGGNTLKEVPCSLGQLKKLTALILSDNQLESLPSEISKLENLKSLLLHKNRLRTLPTEIVSLKCMTELSLRDNPLVVRFVSDMTYEVPSLLELAARCLKLHSVAISQKELPQCLLDYLNMAHHCINPKCKGVFFDSRIEHVKFVDFCGKYRVPLLQYLCSSNCIDAKDEIEVDSDLMRKVLLG